MPRFSKPAVEDENGELNIPGAYQAAPGGICERRSTFEWDNDGRALVNLDDLSIDLSSDSENEQDNDHGHPSRPATPQDAAGEEQDTADVEQGQQAQDARSTASSDLSREIQNPDDPLPASVVLVPADEVELSSDDGCKHQGSSRGVCIKGISLVVMALALLGLVLGIRRSITGESLRENSFNKGNANHDSMDDIYAPPFPALAHRNNIGLQKVISDILVSSDNNGNNTNSDYNNKLEPNWGSPYFQALYWIMYEDPLQVTFASHSISAIQQRFIMAAFYFATSLPAEQTKLLQEKPKRPKQHNVWKQCGRPTNPRLVASSSSIITTMLNNNDPEVTTKSASTLQQRMQCVHQELTRWSPAKNYTAHVQTWRWLSAMHECTWAGVECNNKDQIITIELGDYGLQGTLIDELGNLKALRTLSLPYNDQLTGQVPVALLGMLERLELQNNQHDGNLLEGQISATEDSPLTVLNLAGNSFSGSLSGLYRLTNLEHVLLEQNSFTGSLTGVGFSKLSNLVRLRVADNQLQGQIPTELLESGAQLRELDLSGNSDIFGTIPSQIGLFRDSLRVLRLAELQLEGTLPPQLYELTNLRVLDVQSNQLSGTMATNIGQLGNLTKLYCQENRFEGSLPAELGNLTAITVLHMEGNNFQGEVPSEFCDLGYNYTLAAFAEVVADCLPDDNDGASQTALQCQDGCCSTCCKKSTRECILNPSAMLGLP